MGRDMSFVQSRAQSIYAPDGTGPNLVAEPGVRYLMSEASATWTAAWCELYSPVTFGQLSRSVTYWHSSPMSFEFSNDAMPLVSLAKPAESATYLSTIESIFSDSASDLASMIGVSRQMIYHYRKGMVPETENFRRIKMIEGLAVDVSRNQDIFLKPVLRHPQPEGKSILAFLSEANPDLLTLRRILFRASDDLSKRQRVADSITQATIFERQDIMRDRHSKGRPIYISDPDNIGQILQVLPDKSRVRGKLVNRVFVPDDE